MERSSVELVVDEFADLVDIWDEFLKKIFLFPVNMDPYYGVISRKIF